MEPYVHPEHGSTVVSGSSGFISMQAGDRAVLFLASLSETTMSLKVMQLKFRDLEAQRWVGNISQVVRGC